MSRDCNIVLLALALIAPLMAQAQPKPADGFLGFRWGTMKSEVREAMVQRPGVTFGEETDDGNLIFYGGSYAGYDVTAFLFFMEGEKFYGAQVTLQQVDGSTHTKRIFAALRDSIASQFGQPRDTIIESDLAGSTWHPEATQEVSTLEIILRLREDERITLNFTNWGEMLKEYTRSRKLERPDGK